ncbi:MAG: sulfatase-like hydrolase/transferase [Verrucomicrobiales bacterium]
MHRFKAIVLFVLLSSGAIAEDKPNVLFIFADDQCYKTIQSLNNDEIKTPNLDRLVARGTTFTHAYNMGGWNGAICVASRTMMVTGKFIWNAEAGAKTMAKDLDGQFWPQLMEQAGYDTYFTGKWHVQAKNDQLFKYSRHVRGGMPKQTPQGYNRPVEGQPDKWDPSDPKFGGFWQGGKHWSEVVGDDATDYLDIAKGSHNPFFMYIAFNAPHDPRQAPKKYVDMYPTREIKLPPSFMPEYPWKDSIGCSPKLRDEKLAPFPRTEYAVQVNRREYYAIITHMDDQIGRILDHLEATGQADNTYIFFGADHGLSVGHHGLIGKQSLFDHSMRVPFMVAGPGVPAGKKVDTPIYVQDVMATSLQLADAERPEHVQFKSLMPVLKDEGAEHYGAISGSYIDLQRCVIDGNHKLILYPKIKKALLFDLEADPEEMKDLAGEPGSKPKMQTLFATLVDLQKENGDRLDLVGSYPELAQP